jgi:hypothetical protein
MSIFQEFLQGAGNFGTGLSMPSNMNPFSALGGASLGGLSSNDFVKSFLAGKYPGKVKDNEKLEQDYESLKANRPQDAAWNSMLKGDGSLGNQFKYTAAQLNVPYNKIGGDNFKSILGDAEKRFGGVTVNDTALNTLRNRATSTGPSDWLKLQHQKQALAESGQLDSTAKASQGAMQNAWSQMAARGGVSGGQSARLAKDAMKNQLLASQGVRRGGAMDRLGLEIADEGNRTEMLKALPQAELARSGFDLDKAKTLTGLQSDEQARMLDANKFDVSTAMQRDIFNTTALNDQSKTNLQSHMNEVDSQRKFDLDKWKTNMQEWGSEKTANMQARAGKK